MIRREPAAADRSAAHAKAGPEDQPEDHRKKRRDREKVEAACSARAGGDHSLVVQADVRSSVSSIRALTSPGKAGTVCGPGWAYSKAV